MPASSGFQELAYSNLLSRDVDSINSSWFRLGRRFKAHPANHLLRLREKRPNDLWLGIDPDFPFQPIFRLLTHGAPSSVSRFHWAHRALLEIRLHELAPHLCHGAADKSSLLVVCSPLCTRSICPKLSFAPGFCDLASTARLFQTSIFFTMPSMDASVIAAAQRFSPNGVLMGAALLDEPLTLAHFIFGGLILAGGLWATLFRHG